MKIGNPLDKASLTPVSGRANPADTGGSKVNGAAAESSSTVALSSAATSLVGSEPDFDAGKVERISNAISQGQYTVNPEAIADKLLANAQELLSRPH